MTASVFARLGVAPEKEDFQPSLPLRSMPGLYGADMTKMSYGEQLRHPNWQKRRLEIMGRDGFKCQMCSEADETLHVHHKHYLKGRMAWEYEDFELVTLCAPCHDNQHEVTDKFKDAIARLELDGPCSSSEALALLSGWASSRGGLDLAKYESESPVQFAAGKIASIMSDLSLDELRQLAAALHGVRLGRVRDGLEELTRFIGAVDA